MTRPLIGCSRHLCRYVIPSGDFEPRTTPTRIEFFHRNSIQACAVSCGMGHTVVLDSSRRKAFAFGWNNMGQLGLGHTRSVSKPTQVKVRPHPDV